MTDPSPFTPHKDSIQGSATVSDIMTQWPATLHVFVENRMLCIGCPIAPFHTVHDACTEHELDEATILAQLSRAAQRN